MFINDNVSEFIRSNLKPDEGLLAEMREYAGKHFVPIAKPETAALLRLLGALKRPRRVLEAGTAIGYSSIIMAEYLAPGGRIDTVERDEDIAMIARENIKRSGFDKVINVIIADALEVFSCMEREYDMIFLDAGKGQYREFLKDAVRMLKPGGVLISDNILFMGRVAKEGTVGRKFRTIVTNMRGYIKDLCNNPDFETAILSVGDGVTISVRK